MSQPTHSATETLGTRLARAIADHDEDRLRNLFATPVEFRAVTPRRFWDAETPIGIVDIVLGTWFDRSKSVTDVTTVDDTVGDVRRVSYRMSVTTASGQAVIEQVAYYSEADDRITQLRLVCSGFRPA
jgi:hypothetical protein